MPRVKSPTRVNKSQWIRSQPLSIAAKDLVAKATKEGIQLTIAQVYTARSTASKKGKPPEQEQVQAQEIAVTPVKRLGRPPNKSSGPTNVHGASNDLRQEFTRLVLRLGTDEARQIVERIVAQQN